MPMKQRVAVDSRELQFSNLDKVYFPESGFTKGEVLAYYSDAAEAILPHLRNRPLTMKRYPDGVDGSYFYQKKCPSHRPSWVRTARVPKSEGSEINYCVLNDLPTLVWAANLVDLGVATFLHKAPAIADQRPWRSTWIRGLLRISVACCQVGLWLKTPSTFLACNASLTLCHLEIRRVSNPR